MVFAGPEPTKASSKKAVCLNVDRNRWLLLLIIVSRAAVTQGSSKGSEHQHSSSLNMIYEHILGTLFLEAVGTKTEDTFVVWFLKEDPKFILLLLQSILSCSSEHIAALIYHRGKCERSMEKSIWWSFEYPKVVLV